METQILSINDNSIILAAELLKQEEIVAIPTETVYGLAGNALSAESTNKIFAAKNRPADNPLILHISDIDWLYRYAKNIPDTALRLAHKFWPGPLTMIMQKKDLVPNETSGGLSTAAFRMPDNKYTLKLIELCGFPLAAPSANLSGSPSPTEAIHVYNDLKGKIPLILDGGNCSFGLESTVITFTESGVKILRPGGVTPEMLSEICYAEIDKAVTIGVEESTKALSPGMKYKHYSPKAAVYMIECDDNDKFIEFVNDNYDDKTFVLTDIAEHIRTKTIHYGGTDKEKAAELFSVLRKADELGAGKIYVKAPEKKGIGLAIYNRLIRAAAFKVIKL